MQTEWTRRALLGGLAAGLAGRAFAADPAPVAIHYRSCTLASPRQASDTELRILAPDTRAGRRRWRRHPRVVYILPVQPEMSLRWNDGLYAFAALDLHNRYGLTAVAPSFTDWPWIADHPTDPAIRQESYLLEDVVPLVDRLYPEARAARLLLGFSKSGYGALSLLLRHPGEFRCAAAWDSPLMQPVLEPQWQMPQIYGTPENFERYRPARLLAEAAPRLRPDPARIAILGHYFYADHVTRAAALMTSLGIPHHCRNSEKRAHRWDSGWLAEAVALLDGMSQPA